jgi:prepilin-type N-terminal cleavage/methylation domain-containing protein
MPPMKALNSPAGRTRSPGFTLTELLTVISIIAILTSLLVAVVGAARESARRAAAKADVMNIVAAVNAYYREYGFYPLPRTNNPEVTEVTFTIDNSDLFYTLRAIPQGANTNDLLNPRRIAFLEAPEARNPANPRNGIATGNWLDPWGRQAGKPESGVYHVRIDAAYRGFVSDPYPGTGKDDDDGDSADKAVIRTGVIAWSLARTGIQTYELKDQVLSWK